MNTERVFFLILLALVTLAFLGLLQAFVFPIFWAAAFAILFAPWNERLADSMSGRRVAASLLTLVGIVLLVVLPTLLLGLAVTSELTGLLKAVEDGDVDLGAPYQWLSAQVPVLQENADRFGLDLDTVRDDISGAAVATGQWIAANALRISQNALQFAVGISLMLYLLFFFLRDGRSIIDRIVETLPLDDTRERHLFGRFAEVVRATIRGTFVIAAVQGAIGGIAFAVLGIEGAVLWGVMMALTSLVPVVGPALIWLPATIMLFAAGDIIGGVALIAVGVVLIGLADNLLRPILVGRDIGMPDYMVLLATLGGLAAYGITGLVMGPLIAAMFITLWEMFAQLYGRDHAQPSVVRSAVVPSSTDAQSTGADGGP